jgi:hypothetical protein
MFEEEQDKMQGAVVSDEHRESRLALAEPVSLDRKQLETAAGIKFRDPDALEMLSYAVNTYRDHDRDAVSDRKQLQALARAARKLRTTIEIGTNTKMLFNGLVTTDELRRVEEKATLLMRMRDDLHDDRGRRISARQISRRALRTFVELVMEVWHENGGTGPGSSYRHYESSSNRERRPSRHDGPMIRLLLELLSQARAPKKGHSVSSLHNAIKAVWKATRKTASTADR